MYFLVIMSLTLERYVQTVRRCKLEKGLKTGKQNVCCIINLSININIIYLYLYKKIFNFNFST